MLSSHEQGGQDILEGVEHQEKLLSVLGDDSVKRDMLESWHGHNETSTEVGSR